MKEKRYALRLPEDIYQKVTDYAQSDHRSMNSVIILALDQFFKNGLQDTLESKHILGSLISKSELNEKGLVEIKGLIYHYTILDEPEKSGDFDKYVVAYVDGNKVLLKQN